MAGSEHSVVIAGAGPTGKMLAAELALAGVDVAIAERREGEEIESSRAGGLQARTLEVFDLRGITDRFLEEGQPAQVNGFGGTALDISDFPTRHPYGLALWQSHIERILAGWVAELPVTIRRGCEVVGFAADYDGVEVELTSGESIRARYLVGCDGGRSVIREAAGIGFPGWEATISTLIAEAEMAVEPELGVRRDSLGTHGIGKVDYEIRDDGEIVYGEGGQVRVGLTEREVGTGSRPSLDELKRALVTVYGTDYGIHSPSWISRFTDMTRQAEAYRKGRVLLAGDAAHVHYPVGGHGLSLGIQDAVNLGWKLAQVVKGISPPELLDTYEAERHPVAARILQETMAQAALMRVDDRTEALRAVIGELLGIDAARKQLAGLLSGLDVRYDLGEGHPLLGRRMPDLDLFTADWMVRTSTLLHEGRGVLLNLGPPGSIDCGRWADRVRLVDAGYDGLWELPVIGAVAAPVAVLLRPDGYVAWVAEKPGQDPSVALETWFGPAARGSAHTGSVGAGRSSDHPAPI